MKLTLIADARHWWRMWSVRLAALAGLLAATIVASPELLLGLVQFVPAPWRQVTGAVVGVLVFVIPAVTRLIKQETIDAKPKG